MTKHNIRVVAVRREHVDIAKLVSGLLLLIQELEASGALDEAKTKEPAA